MDEDSILCGEDECIKKRTWRFILNNPVLDGFQHERTLFCEECEKTIQTMGSPDSFGTGCTMNDVPKKLKHMSWILPVAGIDIEGE